MNIYNATYKHLLYKVDSKNSKKGNNTIIPGDFNIPFSTMDRSFRQKMSCLKKLELNYTLYEKNLTDIHRMFHPRAIRYMLFSNAHWTFPKIGYDKTENKS